MITVFRASALKVVSSHPHLLKEEVAHEAASAGAKHSSLHSGSEIHYLYDLGKVIQPVLPQFPYL